MRLAGFRHAMSIHLLLLLSCSAKGKIITRAQILRNLLNSPGHQYDHRIPPDFEEDFPTNVSVQIQVMSLDSVTEVLMEYSTTIFLRMSWTDRRLLWNFTHIKGPLEVDPKLIPKIWMPDVYFINEKRAFVHQVIEANKLMHIFPDGNVRTSTRISMTLSCIMNLAKYPHDEHMCSIYTGIYSYTKENVVLQWHPTYPLQLRSTLILPRLSLVGSSIGDCGGESGYFEEGIIIKGNFSCINADIFLKRPFGYYVMQVYIPSTLTVMISWMSFWIDMNASAARVSINLLTALAITTHSSGEKSTLPRVSYIKAIDVWLSMCLLFTFLGLLEYSAVNALCRMGNKVGDVNTSKDVQESIYNKRALLMDKISRVFFPFLFLMFIIFYWVRYV